MSSKSNAFAHCEPFASYLYPVLVSGQRHRLQHNTYNASDRNFELESIPTSRPWRSCGRVESAPSSIDRIEIENIGDYR
jgi:hypothetical protein